MIINVSHNNYDITGNLEKLGHSLLLLLLPLITLLRKRKAKKLDCYYGDFSSAYYDNIFCGDLFSPESRKQIWYLRIRSVLVLTCEKRAFYSV